MIRFLSCLVASGLLVLSSASRADELTDRVVRAFRAVDPSLGVTAHGDDELKIVMAKGSEPATIYLDNLRKSCNARPDECDAATADYAKAMVAGFAQEAPAAKFSLDKLYPALRHVGYAAQSARSLKDPGKVPVARPFSADVELLFIIDGERAIRYVNLDEQKASGLTPDALLAAASTNAAHLASRQPRPVPNRDGMFALVFDDSLGSARLFDAALWNRIEADAGGPVAVAVPTRDWILFTRLDDATRVAALRELAIRIATHEAYGVSGDVLRREGGGWVALERR